MAYFPFGMGPRVCIGEGFAWMETILVVATIARQWHTQVLNDVKPLPGPMLRTDGPVQALIHRRAVERRAPDAGLAHRPRPVGEAGITTR